MVAMQWPNEALPYYIQIMRFNVLMVVNIKVHSLLGYDI
jgi:hypothetical protein